MWSNNPYGLSSATGASLPDIAEKYRKGISDVIGWGYNFKDAVRKDFLNDNLVPANMAYAQRQYLQNQLGNQVLQDRWDDFANYAASTIGKNRIEAGTAALKAADERQIYTDTRDQLGQIQRNNVDVQSGKSDNSILETNATVSFGNLYSRHANAPNEFERARQMHADVMADPALRGNPVLVQKVTSELQKQSALLQQQGTTYGIPGAIEQGSAGTGSPITFTRTPDGKMIPAYGGETGAPYDIRGSSDLKVRGERATELEKQATTYHKMAKDAPDEDAKRRYLTQADDRMREAMRLRSGDAGAPLAPGAARQSALDAIKTPGARIGADGQIYDANGNSMGRPLPRVGATAPVLAPARAAPPRAQVSAAPYGALQRPTAYQQIAPYLPPLRLAPAASPAPAAVREPVYGLDGWAY